MPSCVVGRNQSGRSGLIVPLLEQYAASIIQSSMTLQVDQQNVDHIFY